MTTATEINFNLDFDLAFDELDRLVLKRPDQPDAVDVKLRRAFPLSLPNRFISISSSEGKELLLVDNPEQLSPRIRQIVDQGLADRSFVPQINRVENVDVRFGYQQWTVHTDRGPAEFRVQEREDIRFLPDGRFRIKDADGNVYDLPALTQLDPDTRRAVEAII